MPKQIFYFCREKCYIIKGAFNGAYDEYHNETAAHKVAWAAVKKKYEKTEAGKWAEK